MFLKKSLLFMTALALLMFAGQASAQGVSFTHVPGEGGTAGMASGTDAIVVELAVTGVPLPPVASYTIGFDLPDNLKLTSAVDGNGRDITLLGTVSALNDPPAVPPSVLARVTFTPTSDVTGMAFSIGISSIGGNIPTDLNAIVQANIPDPIMFNAGGTTPGPGNGGDNGGTGTPTPTPMDLSVSVMSGGGSEVADVAAGDNIVVDVAVSGGPIFKADVTFVVDPPLAAITGGMPATGLQVVGMQGMGIGLLGLSADGSLGSVTFTTGADYDGTPFTINVASISVITTAGKGTATIGDPVMASGGPQPELVTADGMTEITFEDFGTEASVSITAMNFEEGADIDYSYEATADFTSMEDGASLMITTASAGTVTVMATDGTSSASLTLTFTDPDPYLKSDPDPADVIIPEGGMNSVTVTAVGLEGVVTYAIESSGTATINADTDGDMVTITGSGEGSAMVSVTASGGGMTTEALDILFRAMPTVGGPDETVTVPQATVPSAMAMVVATGFPEGSEITFNVDPAEHPHLSTSQDGNVLTLMATGTVSVSVTASGAGVTTSAVEVAFEQALPAAPSSVVVQDNEGDNGHYVMVSFANSANHADVSQYRIYREVMVNTTLDADGNVVATDTPEAKWMSWAVIDAMDNDEAGITRAVVPVTDNKATRWGVAAESGQESSEEVITPSGKRVFSKESVQQLVQFLGMDPNLVVTEDELVEMLMPSADYIHSLTGGRQNVVFAALDPDLSVLIGDVTVPQNIRTDGHLGPIVSSPIVVANDGGMANARDDTAPAMVTDVAADPDTGVITWTASADDGGMDAVMYRGHAIMIPHVTGYKVMASIVGSEAEPIDVTALVGGALPPGSTSLTVPQVLIESLIDRGVPAVLIDVVVMDGTNMTSIVPPLVVELAPKRRLFVDADGNPVFVVKLGRYGAMTPLLVDFEDFVAFTMAYNKSEATSTREEWREFIQADLNDDTVVNFDDFILFFGSYGKEATGPAGKSLVTPVLGVNENAEFLLRLGSDRVVAGETMFVDVSLANVQALMGYGFVLHYDAEKFEFVEAVPAAEDLLKSTGGETPLFRGWSDEAGQVRVMNSIVNGTEVSGDGDIVRLVFRVLRDFENNARFEIADGLVFDPGQLANPLTGGVLDIQTTPTEFALLQNFPNPFNPETTIGYELAESADVTLQIYNVVGQVVRTLMAAEPQSVGRYQVRWDGMDDRGVPVSSGIYFYQISAGKFQDVRKLMLLK